MLLKVENLLIFSWQEYPVLEQNANEKFKCQRRIYSEASQPS